VSANGDLNTRVSDSSVRRLSDYHRILEDLEHQGADVVSSARLAALAGTNPAQIRKDLSYFGSFGKRGSGYRVAELRGRILEILGLTRRWKVVLAGAGNLGQALCAYKQFTRYGFDIVAVFDNDPAKFGKLCEGIPISALDTCEHIIEATGAELAIIATPAASAQAVAERLVKAGIRGFLNFAPRQVDTGAVTAVRHVNITVELEWLSFLLCNNGGRVS